MNDYHESVREFLKESNAIERVYDMQSLSQAIRAWEYLEDQPKMTPGVVRATHKILMLGHLKGKERGQFRRIPVYIGGQEAIDSAEIPKAVDEWCKRMNLYSENYATSEREEFSRKLHVEYEKIHPFVDGNGRTGRMFMNWWRIKNGLPILIIHEGAEQMAYYLWFK